MTKYIKLHTDSANLLRRLSTALYLLSMLGSLALIGFGLIPLYGQRVNAIVAAVNLFEIVNIFSKSFWPVLCTVLYSAAYFFLAAEIVVEAIRAIPSLKLAFGERRDTSEARNNAATVAYKANTCVTSLLVLIILSSLISPYTLSTLDILAFCGLLAIFIAASVLQLCYLKRELVTAFSAPLGRLL